MKIPVWQALRYNSTKGGEIEDLKMLEITNTAVTHYEVWHAFRRAHDAQRRERDHGILQLLDAQCCPEIVLWWYRDEETIRRLVHGFDTVGLPGLEREASPARRAWLGEPLSDKDGLLVLLPAQSPKRRSF